MRSACPRSHIAPLPRVRPPHVVTALSQLNGVRFLFDGERLRENQTPGDLDMEDGDAIDVQIEQVGGGGSL